MSFRFPPKHLIETSPFLDLKSIVEVEQAAELYPGNTVRAQLDAGRFSGSTLTADLGALSYVINTGNLAYETEYQAPPDVFAFSFIFEQRAPSINYGLEMGLGDVLIMPPNTFMHATSPGQSVFGLVLADPHTLLSSPDLSPEVADWLEGMEGRGAVIHAPGLAERLRMDVNAIVDSAGRPAPAVERAALELIAHQSLVTALSMAFVSKRGSTGTRQSKTFDTFWKIRAAVLEEHFGKSPDLVASLPDVALSSRSIYSVLKKTVGLGPQKYARTLRLNRARRILRDPGRQSDTIGDIAAEQGFWDWSRFTEYYRKQFGEPPSQTRLKRQQMKDTPPDET